MVKKFYIWNYCKLHTWESGCELFELVLGQVGAIEGVSDHQVGEVNNIYHGVADHCAEAQHHQEPPSQHNYKQITVLPS